MTDQTDSLVLVAPPVRLWAKPSAATGTTAVAGALVALAAAPMALLVCDSEHILRRRHSCMTPKGRRTSTCHTHTQHVRAIGNLSTVHAFAEEVATTMHAKALLLLVAVEAAVVAVQQLFLYDCGWQAPPPPLIVPDEYRYVPIGEDALRTHLM